MNKYLLAILIYCMAIVLQDMAKQAPKAPPASIHNISVVATATSSNSDTIYHSVTNAAYRKPKRDIHVALFVQLPLDDDRV